MIGQWGRNRSTDVDPVAALYRELVVTVRTEPFPSGAALRTLDALLSQRYGPAYALRGASLIRHGEWSDEPGLVQMATDAWLTGAAELDDGASKALYEAALMIETQKLIDLDIGEVVDYYLRSETSTRRQDPDARFFMIGAALNADDHRYAEELRRRP